MGFRHAVSRIPLAVEVYRRVSIITGARARNRVLRELRGSGYVAGIRISEAVHSFRRALSDDDQKYIRRIEDERTRLLGRDDPLADGSLGEDGPFDAGVTIHDAGVAGKEPRGARLLFLVTRALEPRNVIELGTNVGISSAYIGAALQLNGQGGTLVTLDASRYRLRLARAVHDSVGLGNITYVEGLFANSLRSTLARVGLVDLVFFLGHHEYEPTLNYFEDILSHSSRDAVFVFDGIRWSDGMRRAWSEIQADTRLGLVVDLHFLGIGARHDEQVAERLVSDHIRVF